MNTPQKFLIRDVLPQHLADVHQINQSFVPKVSSVTQDWFQKYHGQVPYFRAAFAADQVLGFLLAMAPGLEYPSMNYAWFSSRHRSFLYVDRIAVAEGAQKLGVGTALYQDLFKFVQGRFDLVTCEVNIRPRNEISLNFHTKLGFQEVGQQDTSGGELRVSMLALPVRYL